MPHAIAASAMEISTDDPNK